jgi:hypothetical protein
MEYTVPEAIMISVCEGSLIISAIFEVPEGTTPEQFQLEAIRSTRRQLNSSTPVCYVSEVMPDGTYIFQKGF